MIVNELIEPKSIVVVGGSNDVRKPGGKVLENILLGKFDGELFVVNPKEKSVQGVVSFPSCKEIPKAELAIFAIPAELVPDAMATLANRGTKAFIVLSAGFSEMGEKGKLLERKLVEIADSVGGSLIGPNCIGVITQKYKGVFAGPIPEYDQFGCDFVSASGATAVFILEESIERGIRFSSIFSVGNSAQVGIEEVLEYWDATYQPGNSPYVKLIYAEQIANPQKFLKHTISLRKKGCKLAAIKAGRTTAGQRAVSSHTGALAGEDSIVEALFKKAGIIRCEGRLDLVNVAGIILEKEPKGNRIAVVTHAGGPGVMLTDTLEAEGVAVPKIEGETAQELLKHLHFGSSVSNPIDFLATGTAEQLDLIIDYIENKFDNIDASAVIFGTPGLFDVTNVYEILYKRIKQNKKPIYPILPSIVQAKSAIEYFKALGGHYFNDEVAFGKALAKVIKTINRKSGDSMHFDDMNEGKIREVIANSKSGFLPYKDTVEIFKNANLDFVETYVVQSLDELEDALQTLEFPVAIKVDGPVHKTEVGGVATNINDPQSAKEKFEQFMQIKGVTGVILQPMASGIELFFGCKYTEGFGHLLVFGLGGIFVEILKDVQINLAPLSKNEALEMVENIKGVKILDGYRNQQNVHKTSIVEVLLRLSQLVEIAPEIVELDINPAFGKGKEIKIVDARIRITK
ncbi:MAG: acetate--CoA ligase family protein [Candidatus Kapaibacteriota bacterium]